jgi:hypothetical protein
MREGAYVFVHMILRSKISCRASLQLPVTDVKVRSWFISKICESIAKCLWNRLMRLDHAWFDDPCFDSRCDVFVLFRAASICRAGSDGEVLAVPDSSSPVSRCKFENLGQDSQDMTRHDEAWRDMRFRVYCIFIGDQQFFTKTRIDTGWDWDVARFQAVRGHSVGPDASKSEKQQARFGFMENEHLLRLISYISKKEVEGEVADSSMAT